MANSIFRVCRILTNSIQPNNIKLNVAVNIFKPSIPLVQSARSTSFFIKRPAEQLWKSVTSVSNAGRRRGRGRGIPRIKDLNKGQKIGFGKVPLVIPGLNSSVLHSTQKIQRKPILPEAETATPAAFVSRRQKPSPFERGWSGGIMGGRKIGPPDPIDGEYFEGFESWILFFKTRNTMSSVFGRVKHSVSIVVTGNGNGLAGFALSKGTDGKSALKTAKNRAGQRLMYIHRYENHTVLHDFFTQFGSTKIFVRQMYPGYGLVCHRVIKACCEAIGIKNMYAKVEGSGNIPHIIKAFFIGLLQQKPYQDMANEKKLYLVEMKKEHGYFPKVVATPDTVRNNLAIKSDEILDFKQYVMGGKVVLKRKKSEPFYTKLPSWMIHLRKLERRRDHFETLIRLRAEYGDVCSFLTEKYPEARAAKWRKKKEEETEE